MRSKTDCLFKLDHWISQEQQPYFVSCDVDSDAVSLTMCSYSLTFEEQRELALCCCFGHWV